MGGKIVKVLIVIIVFLAVAVLIGLVATGAAIGWGPFAFIKYNKKPICLAEEKKEYTVEDIWLKNGAENIFGTLYKAESDDENQPIAILSHSYNGSSIYNKFIAKSLASSRISVYAFDFCDGIYAPTRLYQFTILIRLSISYTHTRALQLINTSLSHAEMKKSYPRKPWIGFAVLLVLFIYTVRAHPTRGL